MIRKIVSALVLILLALVLISFAVANRQIVTVSLDPFDQANPALVFSQPLYVLVFIVLIVGVVVGGCAAWLRQGRWRARARRAEARGAASTAPPAEERLRLIVPPPAA